MLMPPRRETPSAQPLPETKRVSRRIGSANLAVLHDVERLPPIAWRPFCRARGTMRFARTAGWPMRGLAGA